MTNQIDTNSATTQSSPAMSEKNQRRARAIAKPVMTKTQEKIVRQALSIIQSSFKNDGAFLDSVDAAKDFCQLRIAHYEREVFGVIFLTSQHQYIDNELLFFGTIDSAAVSPRECVKAALKHNAGAVIFYHNHPSGIATPSISDVALTKKLKGILEIIDVSVLDHIIVTTTDTTSLAQLGKL